MFFTQEDYRKIEEYLKKKSIKDTQFDEAITPLDGTEEITFVQKGKNVKTHIKDIVDQLFLLGVSDFLNVTDKYNQSYITIEEAIKLIPFFSRKKGQVITFLNKEGDWVIYQFKGESTLQWNSINLWVNLFESIYIDSILPDEEDLTLTEVDEHGNARLKFKDKEYNSDNFSGLGRVYLRKNITEGKNVLLQEMISEANTIYHIQYDYDLNEQEIIIPENCVLQFEGGSFRNGKLVINSHFDIVANHKIFSNISFGGTLVRGYTFNLDWFVNTYTDGVYDSVDIDSSVEMNQAFNSGIKNIIIPNNKYYYLKNKLIINGEINLLSQDNIYQLNTSSRLTNGHLPCIYSNEIVTLLEYVYTSQVTQNSVYIGRINFLCRKKFKDLTEINTPIVDIKTATGGAAGDMMWGLIFDANIEGIDCNIQSQDGTYYYSCNYTGLKLSANQKAMTFIKINGYIQIVYNCIVAEAISSWLTDITINGDTRGVHGGIFKDGAGDPVKIYGSHQPYSTLNYADRGYFEGRYINLYGFVWDINIQNTSNPNLSTVNYAVKLVDTYGTYNVPAPPEAVKKENLHYTKQAISEKDIRFYDSNLLDICNSAKSNKNPLSNFQYTINGESIFTSNKVDLYNSQNLFNSKAPFTNIGYFGSLDSTDYAYIKCKNTEDLSIKMSVDIVGILLEYKVRKKALKLFINSFIKQVGTNYTRLKITKINGVEENIVIDTELNNSRMYYLNSLFIFDDFYFESAAVNYRIEVESNIPVTTNEYIVLPTIVLQAPYMIDIIYGGPKTNRPKIPSNANAAGMIYYDTTLAKYIYYGVGKWRNFDGSDADVNIQTSGVFVSKPSNVAVGFAYFCTDKQTTEGARNGIMIYYAGDNTWVDSLGRVVE